ncbi:sulfatase-like hydrolase/transferase [Pontiellaceae bacterium B12227]|nr:sulfatase-like hydrolase/transferase [Pontiellaceae bacterium B12227]
MENALKILTTLLLAGGITQADVVVPDAANYSAYGPATNTITTFTVQAGDVIAVMGSGNNSEIRTGSNLSISGTAGLVWTDEGSISAGVGVQYWYGTASGPGTVTLAYGHDTNGHIAIGAYQLRSDAGLDMELLNNQVRLNSENNAAISSLDLVYVFGETVSQGMYIEGYASYNSFTGKAIVPDVERTGKFGVGAAEFLNSTGFTHSYTIVDDDTNQMALGGMAFAEVQVSGNPGDIAPNDPRIIFQGSEYITSDASGTYFQRHSDGVLALSSAESGFSAQKAKTTSGISMIFKTDSASVNMRFSHDLSPDIENRNSRFGVYEDGQFVGSYYFSKTESNLTFTVTSATPGTPSVFRLALPNWSKPDFRGLELDPGATLSAYTPPAKKKYVVIGDSISHGTGQGSTYQTYPWIASELLGTELLNLAVGGGKVSVPSAEMLSEFPPVDVISILIGYNDLHSAGKTAEAYAADLNAMIDAARSNQPVAQIFCISQLYTTNPTNTTTGETIQEFRQVVYDAVTDRQAAGDDLIYLIRGEDLTTEADLNDVVHLSEAGAANFATNLFTAMDPIVNPPKPNVLFIAIDDINPIIGAYGNALIQTPNMDALAARGMVFENAHCQWAVCGPSRASLMTGLMPEQGGVMGFTKMRGISADGQRDNAKGLTNLVTIPQYFIEQGYETAASGKINDFRCVGSINPDGTINEDGGTVDDPPSWSLGYANSSGVGSTTAIRTTDSKNVKLAAESVDQPASNFTDGVAATLGIARLNTLAAGGKPFFLGVGFKKPHLPFLAPKSSWDLYDRNDFTPHPFQTEMENATTYTFNNIKEMRTSYYLETNGSGQALPITDSILPDDQQKTLLHGYYACISHVDEQVGRLLDELEALGLHTNTIVVLWGDHGFHLGDHNEWGKHTNLEQATRVPFIISAPGYAPGKTAAPVGLLDIYPTLCELAGLPIPEQAGGRPLSGRSLVPIIGNPAARVQIGIMNHYGSNNYGYAYRTERYRFTEWINSSGTVLARELYDYQTDPMETVNLAAYPEYAALMYQFSIASRSDAEAGGCVRLKASAPMPEPANKSLPGLGISSGEITWPDAAGATYNLMSKTNLTDAVWMTNRVALASSPALIAQSEPKEFFRVEVAY